jgi:hypothetical protein
MGEGAKRRVLVDLKLTIEPNAHVTRWVIPRPGERLLEAEGRALKEWARELEEFVRDHRSQDAVTIDVVRVEQDVCDACGAEWEEDGATGEPFCCNKAVDFWLASRAEKEGGRHG